MAGFANLTPKRDKFIAGSCSKATQVNIINQQLDRSRPEYALLLMRLETLALDPSAVKLLMPDEFRKLAYVCDRCQYKIPCERDLALDSPGHISAKWERYCPNAFRLNELIMHK